MIDGLKLHVFHAVTPRLKLTIIFVPSYFFRIPYFGREIQITVVDLKLQKIRGFDTC